MAGASGGWRPSARGRFREASELAADVGTETDHVPQASFDDLYDQHHPGAYRFALALCTGEAPLAEDAVSEAFAQVYPKWVAGRVTDFGPYLRRAVANQVKAVFRHRGVERREEQRARADDRGTQGFDEQLGRRDQMMRACQE